jgi:hypothetical protein
MSKSDTPLDEIDTKRSRKRLKDPTFHNNRPIHAFDTETSEGDVFMLSVAPHNTDAYTIHNIETDAHGTLTRLSTDTILNELTKRKFSDGVSVWYNLKFDADVIFAGLPDKNLRDLKYENQTDYNGYEINYLPGKSLRIRRNKRTYEHFDISQILPGGLETVAQDWIEKTDGKLNSDLDAEQFTDPQYVRDNLNSIKRYAKQDARLTRDTWASFVSVAEKDLDVPCGKPYSTGYLSADYIRSQLDMKPGWQLNPMQSMAWESYHGGRFEVQTRGLVDSVVMPDINSAYPHVMSQLPDPATLEWESVSTPTLPDIRHADYGFVEITVTTDKSRPWQPFAVKIDDSVKYPALEDYRLTAVKEIFTHAIETGLIDDYEIHSATLGHEIEFTQYPFEWIQDLYQTRKEWESEGRTKPARILKIILNSAYGKTCQTDLRTRMTAERGEEKDLDDSEILDIDFDSGIACITRQVGGKLFNPFLASYITGLTRLELLKQVIEYGLEDETHMLATDSLMIDKEAFESTQFEDDLVKDGLGNWDYDAKGESAFLIGSGVYEVQRDGTDNKIGTRGFTEASLETGLLHAAESVAQDAHTDAIEVDNYRPITLNEARHSRHMTLSDVGKFIEKSRDLRADFDDGRNWDVSDPTYAGMIEHSHSSDPLILSTE